MNDEYKVVKSNDVEFKKKSIWDNARDYLDKNPAEKEKLQRMRKGNKLKGIMGVGMAAFGYMRKNKMVMYLGATAAVSSGFMEYAYSKIFPKKTEEVKKTAESNIAKIEKLEKMLEDN